MEELDPTFCDANTVSYQADIAPILERSCNNGSLNTNGNGICHQSGSPIADYTTFDNFKGAVDAGIINNRVIVSGDMPPSYSSGPRLDAAEIQQLKCWIDLGAPDN
ncbi:MAG: hypothetical protein AAGN35_18380 [Bacteroidota bacterium]